MKKIEPIGILILVLGLVLAGCPDSGESDNENPEGGDGDGDGRGGDRDGDGTSDEVSFGDGNTEVEFTEITDDMPAAGYADGACPVPEVPCQRMSPIRIRSSVTARH